MEWSSVIVAGLALLGTLGGSYFGVRESNKLVNHRLDELEKKMDNYHDLSERVSVVETQVHNLLGERRVEYAAL